MHRLYVSPKGDDAADGSSSRPFATIAQACKAARTMGKGTHIILKIGEHRLSRTLRLGKADSGLVIEAAPGAKAVVSGFRDIAGWRKEADGLWSAPVPWVTAREKGFRSLFVNGEARPRARLPKGDAFFTAAKEECPKGMDWATWAWRTDRYRFEIAEGGDALDPAWELSKGELVMYHYWVDSHVIPKRIVKEDGKVFAELEIPIGRSTSEAIFRLENLREIATEPGEWALDAKGRRVYYRPRKGERMDGVSIAAPFVEHLLDIDGAEDISFSGVTFAGARYELPKGERNDMQASKAVYAAVTLVDARRCRFTNCRFENLGGYALEMLDGTRDCLISHSAMLHLGAGGVRLNADVGSWRGNQPQDNLRDAAIFDPRRRVAGNEVSDCEICDYGLDFPSACGVLLMNAEHTSVIHNHIHDGYYTGVSVGWVWGHMPSVSFCNDISWNHIHDIGKGLLSDMGGIYTLGVSTGTRLTHNLIHGIDARDYGGWGLYNDEGSTGILLEDNVVYDTKFAGYHMHYGRECIVRNNIFGGGRIDQIARTRRMAHISFYFYNNIVYWTQGKLHTGNWDDNDDYDFVFHPDHVRKLRKTIECDWNLYFNPHLKRKDARFGPDLTFEEWQARGEDVNSVWADPKFADPAAHDFALSPDSPALKLGFRPIDLSTVGPR
ncbi:MAG: right-handed parallel beta-helix repeat-containing protein [Kiritimatiellae bacterium]|nr:right-handed parallel beta-helix repeat-containing protein [Kiritimatiellia bacterium]